MKRARRSPRDFGRARSQDNCNCRPRVWSSPARLADSRPTGVTVYNGNFARGTRWADGRAGTTSFQTILPPNSPNLSSANTQAEQCVFSAGSYHQGGAHILMGDGAVIYMTDSVEAGNGNAVAPERENSNDPNVRSGMESPYGLWGSLGSRAAKENVEEQLNQ